MTTERQRDFGDHCGSRFASDAFGAVSPLFRTVLARPKPIVSVLRPGLNSAIAGCEPGTITGRSPAPGSVAASQACEVLTALGLVRPIHARRLDAGVFHGRSFQTASASVKSETRNLYRFEGDVPALMPAVSSRAVLKGGIAHRSNGATNFHGHKVAGFRFDGTGKSFQSASVAEHEGVKQRGSGAAWFDEALDERRRDATAIKYGGGSGWDGSPMRHGNSKSSARKMASAMIAKIPAPVSRHIARVFRPGA